MEQPKGTEESVKGMVGENVAWKGISAGELEKGKARLGSRFDPEESNRNMPTAPQRDSAVLVLHISTAAAWGADWSGKEEPAHPFESENTGGGPCCCCCCCPVEDDEGPADAASAERAWVRAETPAGRCTSPRYCLVYSAGEYSLTWSSWRCASWGP